MAVHVGAAEALETDRYTQLWSSTERYGEVSPGERYCPVFLDAIGPQAKGRFTSAYRGHVLDAGVGGGKGALALAAAGFRVTGCDLTDAGLSDEARATLSAFHPACLWHDLRPLTPLWQSFDWVYCCDVLEHLPPEFTMLAIHRLLQVTGLGLFLSVGLDEDTWGMWVGTPLHQTIRPYVWWRNNLQELGDVVDARDLFVGATFLVRPRR